MPGAVHPSPPTAAQEPGRWTDDRASRQDELPRGLMKSHEAGPLDDGGRIVNDAWTPALQSCVAIPGLLPAAGGSGRSGLAGRYLTAHGRLP
jgi:hypothetical protein